MTITKNEKKPSHFIYNNFFLKKNKFAYNDFLKKLFIKKSLKMLAINLNSEINKLKNYIQNSKNILVMNHRRMDGDCFWSLSAFYYILKDMWYNVKAVNDEWTPQIFQFLNDEEIFESTLNIPEFNPDIIISFDAAALEQLWNIYKNNLDIFMNTTFIVIDHHISNPAFWNINIIDTTASSTCEITWDIIKNFWWESYINSKIATFLLTWIITDTNSFFNTNTSTKALKSASELMVYQPKHQDIIINLFKKKPYNRLKLWGKILESLKDIKNGKVVWNTIPRSLFIQTWTTDTDISWLIDEFLTTIDGLEIWFLLYELDDKKVKWSFRGKTDRIDLSNFCSKWWGGWHMRASWFVIEWKNIFEVEQEIIKELSVFFW